MKSPEKETPEKETLEDWATRVMSDAFSDECHKARSPLACSKACTNLNKKQKRIEEKLRLSWEKGENVGDIREEFRQAAIRSLRVHEECKKNMSASAESLAKKIGVPQIFNKLPLSTRLIPDPETTPTEHLLEKVERLYGCSNSDQRDQQHAGNFICSKIGNEIEFQESERRWFFNGPPFSDIKEIREMMPQFEARVFRVTIAVWILKQWQKEEWYADFDEELKNECARAVAKGMSVVSCELQRIAAAEIQLKKLENAA